MKVLFLNEADVHELFRMSAAVPLMREALSTRDEA